MKKPRAKKPTAAAPFAGCVVSERPGLDGSAAARAVGPEVWPPLNNADLYGLAAAHLGCAVPLRVAAFRRAGGPTAFDRDAVRASAQMIAEHGDDLLYGGPWCASLMDQLIEAVALLSFEPGGVRVAGLHFESGAP